ncbi:PREDICTED: murinoglobulin-2-like [Branchiostoma belcheri]|uniref:Murinoglobulin-2-like n=1 Tax=Branchiostoma belcheri TaxID=7741 RepID=A0A6P4XXI2_BRABE|nr:PREDICTED: murinoglobulin-2-like [Branchiostoma belcheri]
MKVAVFTVLSLLVASATAQRYLVLSPKVLQAGTEEAVCISLFEIEDDVKVSIELSSKDDFEPATVTDVLKQGQDKCVKLKVPLVSSDKEAKLSVYGKGSSYDFKDEKSVKISKKATSTFISTDKPIYKPGQKVQMRILTVKQDLRPYEENIDMVWIEDKTGSRINQWLDVPTVKGLASLEQQLSKEPVLGKWSINAQIADTTYKTTFEVDEYVLPKFEVEISPPPWIPVDMEVIPAVICGKYTYGKPVLGEVKAEFCIKQSYSYGRNPRPCHTWEGKTDKNGCVNIAFDSSLVQLDSTRHSIWHATLRVKADITEDGTGVKLSGSHDTTKIVRENQKLDFRKFSPEGFKPGLPYHGKLYVTDILDNPLADVKVTIEADMTRKNNMYSPHEFAQNFTSNKYGEIPFTLPTYMTNKNVKRLNLNAKIADIPPSKYVRGTYQMENPTAFLSVRSWWSPSSSFLQIQPIHDILPCDSVAEVSILYKTERVSNTKFHYKIMSRGDILHIGTKDVAFESTEEPSTYQPPTTAAPPTTPFTGPTTTEEPIPEDELIDFPPVEIVMAEETFGPPPPPPPPGLPFPGRDVPPPPPPPPPGPNPELPVVGPDAEEPSPNEPASVEKEDINDGEVRRKRYSPHFYRPDSDETPDMPPIPGYTGNFTIKFKVVPSLSPLVRLLVYYVREDGEVVADSTSIKITSCLENNVTMSFPKTSQLPGASTKLTVKASPGSLCSVGVVDKSVHLMRSSNQLTQGKGTCRSLQAFQPFFVSTTLPYSVIRGEEVPLKVSIFNYMQQCQVNVAKLPENYLNIHFKVIRRKITKMFFFQQPEGIEQEYTYSSFFCPKDFPNEQLEDTIKTVLPENLVEGSNRAYLSVIGDLMGPTLSGLDNLVRQPTGCGEQNMVLFAPNIFVMQYLNTTKQLSSEVKDKSLEYMKIGYQRELTYKHKDGSYSAFGESDDSGSTWLSAFVYRCFAQARPYIFIDQKELDHTKKWFAANQKPDGCYQSVGKVLHKAMKGGVNDDTTLTAYIVIAMLESGESVESELVGNALECLLASASNVTSTYGIALMSYALTLAQHPQREEYMEKLENLAIEKDGTVHWEREVQPGKPTEVPDTWFRPYYKSPSAEVEMTSYALLAYMATGERDALLKGLPIVRWLTQQRNAYGGFSSTQDTVMALQALASYAEMAYGEGVDIEVQVQTPEGLDKTFKITDTNSLVLQTVEIPVTPTDISVRATGQGCALLQANVRYNIEEEEPAPSFEVDVNVLDVSELLRDEGSDSSPCAVKMMSICTRFVDDEPSNMAVVAVKMVSGFIPDKTSLKTLKKEKTIKKYEIDGKMVNLYFDELTNEMTCFEFMVEQNIKVKNTKPGVVTVYDYYEEDLKISKKYNINCSPPPPPPPPEEVPELQPFVPVETLFPDSVPAERQGCPTCLLKKEDFSKVFCGSTYAYRMKTNRGRDGHEARIAEDLKDVNSTAPHHTVYIDMGADCQCSELEVDSQVLVMGDRAPVAAETRKHHTLILDEYMTIMPWDHSHKAVQHALTKCKPGSEVNP